MKKTLFILSCVFSFIHADAQIITTIAGSGLSTYLADGLPATAASIIVHAVCTDNFGNKYIAARENGRICKINTADTASTVAGGGTLLGDGGPATAASIGAPNFSYVDNYGNLYITEEGNRIRKVDAVTGVINTIAGTGVSGFSGDGGLATSAQINDPYGIVVDGTGNVYFADAYNNRIRKIDTAGVITTIAGIGPDGLSGGSFGGDGGPATAANLHDPCDMHFDVAGNLYVTDYANNRIRKIDTAGIITTVAGSGTYGGAGSYSGDGSAATSATLNGPFGITVDGCGDIFFSDNQNSCIREINTLGIISTVAGIGGMPGFGGDLGMATAAKLSAPGGVSFDRSGNLLIADYGNARLRMVSNVDAAPHCGMISGVDSVCPGSTVTLHDTVGSGTWGTSSAAISTVGSTGIVTGVAPGYNLITYTITIGGCTSSTSYPFAVKSLAECITEVPGNASTRDEAIHIYPNPSLSGMFTIDINTPREEQADIIVSNLLGEKIVQTTAGTNKPISIMLDDTPGIYIINIVTAEKRWCERIMFN